MSFHSNNGVKQLIWTMTR